MVLVGDPEQPAELGQKTWTATEKHVQSIGDGTGN